METLLVKVKRYNIIRLQKALIKSGMSADDVKVLGRNELVVKFTKLCDYDTSDKEASEAHFKSSDSEKEITAAIADLSLVH